MPLQPATGRSIWIAARCWHVRVVLVWLRFAYVIDGSSSECWHCLRPIIFTSPAAGRRDVMSAISAFHNVRFFLLDIGA